MSALWELPEQSAGDQKARIGAQALLEDTISAVSRWTQKRSEETRNSRRSRSSSLEYVDY